MTTRAWRIPVGMGAALLLATLADPGAVLCQSEKPREEQGVAPEGLRVRSRVVFVDEEGRIVEWSGAPSEDEDARTVGEATDGPEVIFFTEPEAHHDLLLELLGGRSYIGVETTGLSPELRRHFGAPDDVGVLISRVEEGAPADRAGILVGDIVTRVEKTPVASGAALVKVVRERNDGESIEVELYRGGDRATVAVTVAERPRKAVRVRAGGDRSYELVTREEALAGGTDPSVASEEALRKVYEYFSSEEWRRTLEGYEGGDWSEIELRMREVEKRLSELESELQPPGSEPPL